MPGSLMNNCNGGIPQGINITTDCAVCEWIRAMTEKANQEFGQCMQKLSVNEKRMYDETTVQRTERHTVIEIYFLIDCM